MERNFILAMIGLSGLISALNAYQAHNYQCKTKFVHNFVYTLICVTLFLLYALSKYFYANMPTLLTVVALLALSIAVIYASHKKRYFALMPGISSVALFALASVLTFS